MGIQQALNDMIEAGWNINTVGYHRQWVHRVTAFLDRVNPEAASAFEAIDKNSWEETRAAQIGMLQGIVALLEAPNLGTNTATLKPDITPVLAYPRRIFIVHGHDAEAKESVARFTERLGLDSIILHEQANAGRTIIEKFESYANVGFAVVLLTPDDVGAPADKPDALKPRARQNVIFELGYFLGKLTRRRICALYKAGLEIPSDYGGVVYIEFDSAGGWRTKLAQELVEAGFSINLEALLKS